MESVKTVLINFSVVALLCSAFEYLVPDRGKSTMKIITSVILISLIVSPVLKIDFNELVGENGIEISEETVKSDGIEKLRSLAEKEIYKKTEKILINAGVDEYEIYISTVVTEESNEIRLTEIKILTDERFTDSMAELKDELYKEYSETLKIGVKEND